MGHCGSRLPVKETDGTYGKGPSFKDPGKGDLTISSRKPQDAGVRADEQRK
jgi:hypothetical protein